MSEAYRSKSRTWLVAIPLLGAAALIAASLVLATTGSDRTATTTANLKPAHVNSENPGFGAEEDERCEGQWGWHFVMPSNTASFVSLTATFETAGAVAASDFYNASTQVRHAYVFTPGPDKLLSATAQVDGPTTEFNLSHVCTGGTTTTTAQDPTTATTEATTTTVPETTTTQPKTQTTTTTVPQTTTTVPDTTTTTVPETTTTVPETTTTTEPETTTTTEPPTTTTPPATPTPAPPTFTG